MPSPQNPPFRARIFGFVPLCCFLFVVLTAVAMLCYPGGVKTNHDTRGYSFLVNFFSDLGRGKAWNGVPNSTAAPLFKMALIIAGGGLMLFFCAFSELFQGQLWTRVGALWGALMGFVSGICFMGVGLMPVDVNGWFHAFYVIWAFRCFFLAVIAFAIVIFAGKSYPKIAGWIFIAFAGMLFSYIQLLTFGPNSGEPTGLVIQATGQKMIVYASVLCVWLQAVVAKKHEIVCPTPHLLQEIEPGIHQNAN